MSTKSSLSETPIQTPNKTSAAIQTPNKTSPATPRVSKLRKDKSETESPSTLQKSRLSVDRSPKSVNSKPTIDRKSPRLTTPIDKQTTKNAKGSEMQLQLSTSQDELKKAKEQLVFAEQEKAKTVDELKAAQKEVEEANSKLQEALVAQKRAEENNEIEKFRAVELEQAGIEASQKKEEEWNREFEAVRSQHALDVSALLSATQELQRVKQELVMTCDAKNQALSHADDVTKIAEIQAERVEILSAELMRLKALLDSKLDMEASENESAVQLKSEIEILRQELEYARSYKNKLMDKEASENEAVVKLKSEIEILRRELEYAGSYKDKLMEKEASENEAVVKLKSEVEILIEELEYAGSYKDKLMDKEAHIEQLNVDVEAAKIAESYARSLVDELSKKVEELETRVEVSIKLERSASESLDSLMTQVEGNNRLLHDADSEIAALKEKVGLFEMTIGRQKRDLEDCEHRLNKTKEEGSEMSKIAEALRSELQVVKEEKAQALNKEKLAASSVQTLSEEKNKLITELESSRVKEEKTKKAMESLASALHEVSAEAREAKEKLLFSQADQENFESQIEDLRLVLKETNEKYKSMLDVAKNEINLLTGTVEKTKNDFEDSKVEWDEKELQLVDHVKKSEEENSSLEKEIVRLVDLLKQTEQKAFARKEEVDQLQENLKEVETEVIYLQETLGQAKGESMKLKENLLDKENELQNVLQENEDLHTQEAASLRKNEELSRLLEEALSRNQSQQNGDLSDSEKDYDMLPKVVEFSEENGHAREDSSDLEIPPQQHEDVSKDNAGEEKVVLSDKEHQVDAAKVENLNGNPNEEDVKKKDDSVEAEFKMWESCKIEKKEFSPEREAEHESFEEEMDSKVDNGDGFDQINGVSPAENIYDGRNSPSKQQQKKKKKKPLFGKFGSMLKKKGSISQR